MPTLPIKQTLTTVAQSVLRQTAALVSAGGTLDAKNIVVSVLNISMLRWFTLIGCLLTSGCAMLPEIVHQPTLHNPFPQISKVAVATFFNASSEPTLDGRKVAEAYAAELAEVPGYVVIPVSQVDTAMRIYGLQLDKERRCPATGPDLGGRCGRRRSGHGIHALLSAAADDASPWFTANPNFHPIPAGYGLPWGTAGEKDIPGPLVFQAELALAKEQLKTQTPPYQKLPLNPPRFHWTGRSESRPNRRRALRDSRLNGTTAGGKHDVRTVSHEAADPAKTDRQTPQRRRQVCAPDRAGDLDAWRNWSGTSANLARPARIHSPAAHGAARRPACPATSR